eukprot:6173545-Pleurochrysis_carterae.AAC.1
MSAFKHVTFLLDASLSSCICFSNAFYLKLAAACCCFTLVSLNLSRISLAKRPDGLLVETYGIEIVNW